MNLQKPVTVLMADDDLDDQLMTSDAFRDCQLRNPLRFVQDGEELLDYLYRRGNYSDCERFPMPGLILLDLNMPRMDGREALREIKQSDLLKHIPVVVLSTSTDAGDITSCYHEGSNSYIAKPSSFSDLLNVVQKLGEYWLDTVNLPQSRC